MVLSALVQATLVEVWFKPLIYRERKRRPERPRAHPEPHSKVGGGGLGQNSGVLVFGQGSAWQLVRRGKALVLSLFPLCHGSSTWSQMWTPG